MLISLPDCELLSQNTCSCFNLFSFLLNICLRGRLHTLPNIKSLKVMFVLVLFAVFVECMDMDKLTEGKGTQSGSQANILLVS